MSMMSPEVYYQMNLEGQSKEEILTNIRSLKRSINQLKRAAEDPEFEDHICPSVNVRLSVEHKVNERDSSFDCRRCACSNGRRH